MCCKYAVGAFWSGTYACRNFMFSAKTVCGFSAQGSAAGPCILRSNNNTAQTVFMEPALPFISGTFLTN